MKNFGYDLGALVKTFGIDVVRQSLILNNWLSAQYELNTVEQANFDALLADAEEDGGYWNEEELKINFVGMTFRIAGVNTKQRIKVFYERRLAATVDREPLSVITDCLIAKPLPFNTPTVPYFFLQEFKKKRGEKNDPEGQMLTAMLIAQELNQDNVPLYGGFLFGPHWQFAVLDERTYCNSRTFDATNRADLLQIIFSLRKLKELILNR